MTRLRATIYDIARAAGSSPATVSLVLSGRWAAHRISKDTAQRVLARAHALGYKVNLRARALRLSRSGLAGMIIPHYRNRFFAGLAENFEMAARARGLCPIVASTQRDAAIARHVTETLLAQQVEFLFTAGVQDPDRLNALCREAAIFSVNIDLPGRDAASVVSDNRGGAHRLTRVLIEKMRDKGAGRDDVLFLGGIRGEFATDARLAGFEDAWREIGMAVPIEAIDCCGYLPEAACRSLIGATERVGRMPQGLFINSITAFEGLALYVARSGRPIPPACPVVCFDWDPFAAHLPFDVTMMRQDVEGLIAGAFALLDGPRSQTHPTIVVPTMLALCPGPM